MFEKYKNYVPFEKMTAKDNVPEYIVVHHSASLVDDFNSIQRYHITDKDHLWENIGYHYIIERDGTLKIGRPELYHGGHVKEGGMNKKSIGICLCGDFDQKLPSTGQIEALKGLLQTLSKKYKIKQDKIVPHRHFALNSSGKPYKSCFGKLLSDDFASKLLKQETNDCVAELYTIQQELTETKSKLNWLTSALQTLLNKLK